MRVPRAAAVSTTVLSCCVEALQLRRCCVCVGVGYGSSSVEAPEMSFEGASEVVALGDAPGLLWIWIRDSAARAASAASAAGGRSCPPA